MVDIRKILKKMTIEEKIGQLMQYNAFLFIDTDAALTGARNTFGLTKKDLEKVGSVLNFAIPCEMRKIQDKHLANDRNKIPMT